jgi:uncharacterized protein YhfF
MHQSVATMWADYLATMGETPETTNLTYTAWHFEITPAGADKLAALVLKGQKRGTASCLWVYDAEGDPIPRPGDLSIITNWEGVAQGIIQAEWVMLVPFSGVSVSLAQREGEGDGSLKYWQDVHIPFFEAECRQIGRVFTPDMPVVFEAFNLIYPVRAV